jgi:streptogramin lyase
MVNDATPPLAAQSLFVANGLGDSVFQYNLATGASSAFASAGSGGLDDPQGLTFGPGRNLYVTGERLVAGVRTGSVFRYNGTTGAFIDVFVANTGDLGSFGIKFGPDGNLYVANINLRTVSRFNGTTGALIGDFVTVSGGLVAPRDLVFGPDGNLYVASADTDQVRRYNGATGALIDVFALGVDARGLAFGPGGDLYVANFNGNNVLRFDGVTGAFKAIFASGGGLSGPVGVLFGTDGRLYVSSFNNNQILRYDSSSGAFIDVFASGIGLINPRLMVRVIETTPPVLNLPASFAVNATSPAGATVNYTVTATDNSGVAPTVSCTPESGRTFAIGSTPVNCTATDAARNSATGSFTVTVNGAVAQLTSLIAVVGSFNNPWGITNSLDTKLQHAIDALNAMKGGSASSACNSLIAFINEAQAQSGKKLAVAQANLLIESANQIRAVLGCP